CGAGCVRRGLRKTDRDSQENIGGRKSKDRGRPEGTMGPGQERPSNSERRRSAKEADAVSRGSEKDCGGAEGPVGKGPGTEGGVDQRGVRGALARSAYRGQIKGLRAGIEEKTIMAQKRRIFIFLSAFLVLLPLPVLAWNDVGHMAVAYIAYQRLNPATRTRAAALLKVNPDYPNWVKQIPEGTSPQDQEMLIFMIRSTWADQIKHESGYTPDGVPGSNGNLPEGAASAQNIGYKDKLQHRYWHFIDIPFSVDGTKLPPVPTPNAETQIAAFRKVLAAASADDDLKSYDLTWLLHIAGDIHQPLHCVTRVSSAEPDGDKG